MFTEFNCYAVTAKRLHSAQLLFNLLTIGFVTSGIIGGGQGHQFGLSQEEVQKFNYPDQIVFPTYSTYIERETTTVYGPVSNPMGFELLSKLGQKCLTLDGIPGLCVQSSECSDQMHSTLQTYSQRILQCRSVSLVCCPEKTKSTAEMTSVQSKPTTAPTFLPKEKDSMPASENPKENLNILKPTLGSSTSALPNSELNLDDEERQGVCGVMNSKDVISNQVNNNLWPWLVTIGKRYDNGTIDWVCLGSLIKTNFILTAAHCFQRSPNIVAIGTALLGRMTKQKSSELDIHSLASFATHEKFIAPKMYKNIGLGQLASPVRVTTKIVPVCFPFLAGVLDIVQFINSKAKTVGFETQINPSTGIKFRVEEYRVLNNSQCANVFEAQKPQTLKRFPFGIRSENMCGLNKDTDLCQAPGAPLVILDSASESYVQIGISSGDPTCSEMKRSIVTFTRLNSFSSWVRDRVGSLPSPPPCYF